MRETECWLPPSALGGGPWESPSEWDPSGTGGGWEQPESSHWATVSRAQCLGDDLVTRPQTPGQKPDTLELAAASPVLSLTQRG